jgi:hypothetical protein
MKNICAQYSKTVPSKSAMVLYKKIRKWEVMLGLKAVGHSGLVWGYEKWCLFSVPLWIGLGLREFASLIIQIFFWIMRFSKSVLGFSESLLELLWFLAI